MRHGQANVFVDDLQWVKCDIFTPFRIAAMLQGATGGPSKIGVAQTIVSDWGQTTIAGTVYTQRSKTVEKWH